MKFYAKAALCIDLLNLPPNHCGVLHYMFLNKYQKYKRYFKTYAEN